MKLFALFPLQQLGLASQRSRKVRPCSKCLHMAAADEAEKRADHVAAPYGKWVDSPTPCQDRRLPPSRACREASALALCRVRSATLLPISAARDTLFPLASCRSRKAVVVSEWCSQGAVNIRNQVALAATKRLSRLSSLQALAIRPALTCVADEHACLLRWQRSSSALEPATATRHPVLRKGG